MSNAVQRNFPVGAVEASDRKYGIAIIENSRGTVGVGKVELVAQKKRLRLYREISQAGGIDTDDRTVLRVTIEEAICEDALAKFAVTAVKACATQNA